MISYFDEFFFFVWFLDCPSFIFTWSSLGIYRCARKFNQTLRETKKTAKHDDLFSLIDCKHIYLLKFLFTFDSLFALFLSAFCVADRVIELISLHVHIWSDFDSMSKSITTYRYWCIVYSLCSTSISKHVRCNEINNKEKQN